MVLKKKGLKIAVAALAIASVMSSMGLNNSYADSANTELLAVERTSEENSYVVKNTIQYIKDGVVSDHGYESLRSNISEDTLIEVKNNKIYMTIEFTEKQYSMIDGVNVTVDGVKTEFSKTNNRKYTVEIGRFDADIQLNFDVNIPVEIPGLQHNFTVNYILGETTNTAPTISANNINLYVGDTFDAKSIATAKDKEEGDLTSEIEVTSNNVDTKKAGNYSVTYKVADSKGLTTTKTITVTVSEKEVSKPNTLEDGKYTIKNKTAYTGTSSVGASMVRNSLKEVSYVEIKDGSVYVTLQFDSELYKVMQNLKITVDGKEASITKDGSKVTFKVDSINSKIGVSTLITAMGNTISYNVSLDESTIEKTSSSNTGGTTTEDSNTGGTTTEGTTGGSSSSGSTSTGGTTSGSTTGTTVTKGKLYTIKNTVSHSSQTGQEMARKYLNSTSKVEIVDGQTYVTLTFTGASYMNNHAIYVNGSKVSHTVPAKSGDSISLRFKVSSLSDTIKVGTYVVPMSRNIEFTVKLLEDTLTFVKDYEVTGENGESLPQTGSIVNSSTLFGAGSSLLLAGGLLNRRKRK